VDDPWQMVGEFIATVGIGLTVTVTVFVEVQPRRSVAVTVYVVVVFGVAVAVDEVFDAFVVMPDKLPVGDHVKELTWLELLIVMVQSFNVPLKPPNSSPTLNVQFPFGVPHARKAAHAACPACGANVPENGGVLFPAEPITFVLVVLKQVFVKLSPPAPAALISLMLAPHGLTR
jgi:hypothetical protein